MQISLFVEEVSTVAKPCGGIIFRRFAASKAVEDSLNGANLEGNVTRRRLTNLFSRHLASLQRRQVEHDIVSIECLSRAGFSRKY